MQNVAFTQMKDGTTEEYLFLQELEHQYILALPDRLMESLRGLGTSLQGYQISRLEHSLQSATRAQADGADVDMVVGALLHDIGDVLAPENHSQMAAAILRPYVRAEVTWVIEMHGLFQMEYYAHHFGKDPHAYLAYKDHPWFAACHHFCACYDQAAFDPNYPTQTLEYFEPMLRAVFSRKAFDPAVIQAAA